MPALRKVHESGVKPCTGCKNTLSLECFRLYGPGKNRIKAECHECERARKKAYRSKPEVVALIRQYKQKNKEKSRAQARAWNKKTASEIKKAKAREVMKSDHYQARRREYLKRPEVRARVLELRRQRRAERYRSSVAYQINGRMSGLIRRSLVSGKNTKSWRQLVDWDIEQFIQHFERQFTEGMSWEIFLSGAIHIDHIRPLVSFNYKDANDPEFIACWGLPNLRPLWASANHKKKDSREFLL